jgi:hypothetical protein
MPKTKKINEIVKVESFPTLFPFIKEEEARASIKISKASTRTNVSSRLNTLISTYSERFKNIWDMEAPYSIHGDLIDIAETIDIVEKAYFNFPLLRNTIDIMTELSNSAIYLKGGSKKVKDFISAWFNIIGLWSLKERFFREFFRSGNVFLYRFDGKMPDDAIKQITKIFGASKHSDVPLRYVMLNAKSIRMGTSISLLNPDYYQIFTSLEANRLKNPKTQEDKELYEQLTPDEKKQLKSGSAPSIKLKKDRIYPVFYKKQDYEPFAVPMSFPVLDSINWKMELQKIDRAIAKTTDWAILLITYGAKPEEGGVNSTNFTALQELFKTDAIKRVLVSDYTTKGEWLIPDIDKILGPEKYKEVNEDIRQGLNIILGGEEKFANSMIKVKVFLERLKQARNAFLNEFLVPEIKRICQEFGFKNYPTPYFEEIDLKDEIQYSKVFAQLAQLGYLTPEETFDAFDTGMLPDNEDSIESQREFKKLKDEGLYQPLINVKQDSTGRPGGTKSPQTTKNVGPIGGSFTLDNIKKAVLALSNLDGALEKFYKKTYKIKELSNQQKELLETLAKHISLNEPMEKWEESIENYSKNPLPIKEEASNELISLENEFNVNERAAMILYHSKAEKTVK